MAVEQDEPIPVWSRWEARFAADELGDVAAQDVQISVKLISPQGERIERPGFWDGGNDFAVRFMPDDSGQWNYRVSTRPELQGVHGQKGTFQAVAAGEEETNPLLIHGPLRVALEGRYLMHADETPFFWMGDTTWNGPAKSDDTSWQRFLDDRRMKKFNVIQYNAVTPWRAAPTDAIGQTAFSGREKIDIHPEYFQRLDKKIDAINDAGMVAAHILLWSLTDNDPGKYLPESEVIKLVEYQLARYGAHHMCWLLAGDNPHSGERGERWKRIGEAVFGEPDSRRAPVTTHPTGMNFPWADWEDQRWLDFLGYQSGHGDDARKWTWIHSGPAAQYWEKTNKPIINLEPCYEDHNAYHSKKPHSAYNVRRDVYFSLLSHPPVGVTYGAHGIWSWELESGNEPLEHRGSGVAKIWHEAMELPGSSDMQHVVELFTSLDWWKLLPADQLVDEPAEAKDPGKQVVAARAAGGKQAVIYLPVGGKIKLNHVRLWENLEIRWFDPRTGKHHDAIPIAPREFEAPSEDDWVLELR